MKVQWSRVEGYTQVYAPTQAHPGEDAGWDVYTSEDTEVSAFEWVEVPTGIIVVPEEGWWFEITGRSSSGKNGIDVRRGIIDNGYRGELIVHAKAREQSEFVPRGSRLAQIIFHRIPEVEWEEVEANELPVSSRLAGGFGSSGK